MLSSSRSAAIRKEDERERVGKTWYLVRHKKKIKAGADVDDRRQAAHDDTAVSGMPWIRQHHDDTAVSGMPWIARLASEPIFFIVA
jgi:hypothetical protein